MTARAGKPFLPNTLTRTEEEVRAPPGGCSLKWYTCGPTVYAQAHIGHARVYIGVDVIIRVLEGYFHLDVDHGMNVTDIDDKIVAQAGLEGVPFQEVAARCERAFGADLARLGVRPPQRLERVTDNIPEIVDMIRRLVEIGDASLGEGAEAGSVYFDVRTACARKPSLVYAKFAQANGADASTARFALWKARSTDEPGWDAPWGRGVPGWHVECSAIASKMFGDSVDVHAGGVDLQFPHHCNECAVTEACSRTDEPWVKRFVHVGRLNVAGKKMSKSEKNYTTIGDFLEIHDATSIRLLFLLHPWQLDMQFNDASMVEVAAMRRRLEALVFLPAPAPVRPPPAGLRLDLARVKARVHACLCDSVDTRGCLKALCDLSTFVGCDPSDPVVAKARAFADSILRLLGVEFRSDTRTDTDAPWAMGAAAFGEVNVIHTSMRSEAKRTPALYRFCDMLRTLAEAARAHCT